MDAKAITDFTAAKTSISTATSGSCFTTNIATAVVKITEAEAFAGTKSSAIAAFFTQHEAYAASTTASISIPVEINFDAIAKVYKESEIVPSTNSPSQPPDSSPSPSPPSSPSMTHPSEAPCLVVTFIFATKIISNVNIMKIRFMSSNTAACFPI